MNVKHCIASCHGSTHPHRTVVHIRRDGISVVDAGATGEKLLFRGAKDAGSSLMKTILRRIRYVNVAGSGRVAEEVMFA